MKSVKIIVLITFVLIVLSGCDELVKKDVDIPINFNVTQNVVVPGDSDPNKDTEFVSAGEYDILSHPDVANAIGTPDKIKKVKITEIFYEFKNFSGNVDADITGNFVFPKDTKLSFDYDTEEQFYIGPVRVANADLFNELYTLDENFDNINSYLSTATIFYHAFIGSSTDNPAIFDIVLKVSATVTVEASLDFEGNYN
ncbi:hypothetical protein GM418_27715 [Maribellus comscasis]|uniref:Uncharacterized protein n=1 Tax=Maribellus comscasis TaxID=2681766 RepID=A0A6I6K3Z6_9BACT|nr:hypothetical protein [Maribellus comscasis]QGY47317.1 hypothetical protein GM418_27715 [Maribellus comscasis]